MKQEEQGYRLSGPPVDNILHDCGMAKLLKFCRVSVLFETRNEKFPACQLQNTFDKNIIVGLFNVRFINNHFYEEDKYALN